MTSSVTGKKRTFTTDTSTRDLGKVGLSADFEPGEFDKEIRDNGYLCYWSAAELCPCRSNSKTDQPDTNCASCDGSGFYYAFPDPLEKDLIDYTKLCPEPFANTSKARATQALITSMSTDPSIFERFGEWIGGAARLTTFSWHRTSFRDRFVMVESTMPYKQVVKVPKSGVVSVGRRSREQVRYPAIKLLKVSRLVNEVAADVTADATISDVGAVDLTDTDLTEGDLVSIRYEMNPVWIVVDYPYAVRDTRNRFKQARRSIGTQLVMPTHAVVKLDFLLQGTP